MSDMHSHAGAWERENLAQSIRLARLAWSITSLGPGPRLGLWVAGCQMRCQGCITPELQSESAGRDIGIAQLAQHILSKAALLDAPLQGLSLSGGEPFDQAAGLTALWLALKTAQPDWNLLVFSGYPWSKLQNWPEAQELLAQTDLLISGPYQAENPGSQSLQASANHERLALSPSGKKMLEQLDQAQETAQVANIGMGKDGRGWLIGVFDEAERRSLHQRLGLDSSLDSGLNQNH
jgi:anaerobic ribonucleoside-triphosphate reductase activating protein